MGAWIIMIDTSRFYPLLHSWIMPQLSPRYVIIRWRHAVYTVSLSNLKTHNAGTSPAALGRTLRHLNTRRTQDSSKLGWQLQMQGPRGGSTHGEITQPVLVPSHVKLLCFSCKSSRGRLWRVPTLTVFYCPFGSQQNVQCSVKPVHKNATDCRN